MRGGKRKYKLLRNTVELAGPWPCKAVDESLHPIKFKEFCVFVYGKITEKIVQDEGKQISWQR